MAEVVLFDVPHALPPETHVYGEGFQMLSQTGGTIGQPADLGDYTDAKHYRMPQPADATVAYSLLDADAARWSAPRAGVLLLRAVSSAASRCGRPRCGS